MRAEVPGGDGTLRKWKVLSDSGRPHHAAASGPCREVASGMMLRVAPHEDEWIQLSQPRRSKLATTSKRHSLQ